MKNMLSLPLKVLLTCLLSASGISHACEPSTLEHIQSKLNSTYASGEFTQARHLNGLLRPLISKGEFKLDTTLGIIWHVATPISSTTHLNASGGNMDGENIPQLAVMYEILNSLISGDWSQLNNYFAISNCDLTKTASTKLTLTPKHQALKQHLSQVVLLVSSDIETIILRENQTDFTEIAFKNIQRPLSKPASANAEFGNASN